MNDTALARSVRTLWKRHFEDLARQIIDLPNVHGFGLSPDRKQQLSLQNQMSFASAALDRVTDPIEAQAALDVLSKWLSEADRDRLRRVG